jgi:hypothetical protein
LTGTGSSEASVEDKCVTLRLTPAQREAVREATGKSIEAISLPVTELEGRAADTAELPDHDEALVWECLNPYP